MQITNLRVYQAFQALDHICKLPLDISPIAKYRLKRTYEKLAPDWERLDAARVEMIKQFGEELFVDEAKTQSTGQWGLKPNSDGAKAFDAEWTKIIEDKVEVEITPIPFEMLALTKPDGKWLEVNHLVGLGELVSEPKEE